MAQPLEFGLLWFDGDPKRAVRTKIGEASARYQAKFGHRPNACYVHPDCLPDEHECDGVRIFGAVNILRNHFWIGVLSANSSEPQ